MSNELTLEQAIAAAKAWQDNDDLFFPPEVLTALLEAIEAMTPVVSAAEVWYERGRDSDLLDAVDTYREKRGKGE